MHVKRFKGSTSDRGSFQSHLYVTYQLSDRAIQKDTAFDSSEDNLYLLAGTSVRILCVVTEPGLCPVFKCALPTLPPLCKPPSCTYDSQCPGTQKCCKGCNGCGFCFQTPDIPSCATVVSISPRTKRGFGREGTECLKHRKKQTSNEIQTQKGSNERRFQMNL